MVRSLWSAASGMLAEQTNVDTIANNLANVSTTGYKTQQNQFKSLLYQTLQTKTTAADGTTKPTAAQVGLGVRNAAITTIYTQGELLNTGNTTDFAIQGNGLFAIKDKAGNTAYTRNGNFLWAINSSGGISLTTTDGSPVLSTTGAPISLASTYSASKVTISSDGSINYPDASNNPKSLGVKIGLYQFQNPGGLEKEGDSLYKATAASGTAINESTSTAVNKSTIVQGYLEGSNVQVADEMVNLITAQRAYELNSKAITASDQMMQQANNLRS